MLFARNAFLRSGLTCLRSELGLKRNITNDLKQVNFTARGVIPPVFTPLNKDFTINYGVVSSYAKYLADAGIKSVLVGGTTGENVCLSVPDRKSLVDEWVKAGSSYGLHIMVQVGGGAFADVLSLAQYCEKAGADSILTLPELYFRPQSVPELVFFMEQVAQAAPNLPVLYYNFPRMSKVDLNMKAFVTAATERIPNFKGLKFSSNDLSEAAELVRMLKDDQEIFLGTATLLAPAALLGLKSSIATVVNIFPRLTQDIFNAMENNDLPKAKQLQSLLTLAIEAHAVEGAWVPTMKAGMEIVTEVKVGPPALPQKPISNEAKERIANRLKKLGLL